MSDSVRFEDFFSDSDASLWIGERDPRLRSTIVSVWVLDRMPDEEDFEAMLAESVEAIPRLIRLLKADDPAIVSAVRAALERLNRPREGSPAEDDD